MARTRDGQTEAVVRSRRALRIASSIPESVESLEGFAQLLAKGELPPPDGLLVAFQIRAIREEATKLVELLDELERLLRRQASRPRCVGFLAALLVKAPILFRRLDHTRKYSTPIPPTRAPRE